MYIKLDLESDIPIYEQLKNEIIAGIARKELAPGERLPSVRAFAKDIGVNMHTVNKAYQQLRQEGFILIHRQRGVVVNPDGTPLADNEYMDKLTKILHPAIAESICRGISKEEFLTLSSEIFDTFIQKEEE